MADILITGASGLIGGALKEKLSSSGSNVYTLGRSPHGADFTWNPENNQVNIPSDRHFGAVIHLAGENLSRGRWTPGKKQQFLTSRVRGTELLIQRLSELTQPPRTFLCASAIGFYGNRGDAWVDESGSAGRGFLAHVCREWEAASAKAADRGMRCVQLRLGMVLSPLGGALAKMLPLFKFGLGGRLGSGRQYMSWITLPDVVNAVQFILERPEISGPVNLTAPGPVTNAEFTRTLARTLKRPALLPAPAFALKLLLGEMAEEMILSSARVLPSKLQDAGYSFLHPDIGFALAGILH